MHDAGEPVLADVVAQAEHHRVVDRVEPRRRRPLAFDSQRKHLPSSVQRVSVSDSRQKGITHARAIRRAFIDEGSAVEDQLVLATDLVDVRQAAA